MAGLRFKAVEQSNINILETGFGTGLNAFMTLLEAEKRNLNIEYSGLETYPIAESVARDLNYPELLGETESSAHFLSLHSLPWRKRLQVTECFSFQKLDIPIEQYQVQAQHDIIYFDAFAPQAQPELWSVEVMERMFTSLKDQGILVTYCAQGEFKRNLKKAGFTVEKLQGPPGKREMTRALKV